MRISDWSSDVCSSDLDHNLAAEQHAAGFARANSPEIGLARLAIGDRNIERAGDGIDAARDRPFSPALEPPVSDFQRDHVQIGRTSCRERVWQYVWLTVSADALKEKKKLNYKYS